jgi:DNA polymerase-3 subunit beta
MLIICIVEERKVMQVICKKNELIDGVQMVLLSNQKSSLPVLSNLLFETHNNKVRLSSTDLEIAIECCINAEIISDGGITIPIKNFLDIIKEFHVNDVITITTNEVNHINITSGMSRFNLMGIPRSEYPVIPKPEKNNCFIIKKNILIKMLKKTVFSTSRDMGRYVLNGVYFFVCGNNFSLTATDGKRLAHNTTTNISFDTPVANAKHKAIVPARSVNDMLKLLSLDIVPEDVCVYISSNQITIKINDIMLLSTLIDGVFPSYEQVVPNDPLLKIRINAKDMLSAVKQLSVFTKSRVSTDMLSSAVNFCFDKDMLKISASTIGVGSGESNLNIKYNGSRFEINFNPSFIKDALHGIGDEFAIFGLTDSLSPAIISPEDNMDCFYVVMPIRV